MTYLTFTKDNNSVISTNRAKPSVSRAREKTAVFSFLLVLFIFVFVILNLISVNSVVKIGYGMRDEVKTKRDLEERNKNLEIQISQLKSARNLEIAVKNQGLVEVDKISYIKTGANFLVRR